MGTNSWRAALRWVRDHPDLLLALAAALISVVGATFAARHQHADRSLDVWGYLLLLAGPAFLIVRRRWPVAVLAGVFAATFGYIWLGYPQGPVWLPLIVAFGGVVLMGKRLAAYTALVAGFVATTWLSSLFRADEKGPSLIGALGIGAWLLTLAAITELIRYRGELRRAARREEVEAQRTREESARRRASEERLDIARELHDVLAHSISMINVQAGVALELIDERPEQARASLATIKQASKDALVEVQAVLGALRQAGEHAATAPAPSIADLDRLVSGARAAGLEVHVHTDGSPHGLPAGTDLAAYRILQESLTNVVRHAGATAVTVTVHYATDQLTVEVADNGHGPARAAKPAGPDGGGNGIAGMRERAEALGGELSAGRLFTGGFRVRARLPIGESH
ncbi:MAG TPA: sensor histidine kinase [Jatrophihabitantaceae bacterium]|jgi:signal transduction histidine kinase